MSLHFDHPTHQLPRREEQVSPDIEMWCGGTIPPTLVEANFATRELTVHVHDEDTDVHAYPVTDEPLYTEVRQESKEGDFDAYTISRGAIKTVRMLKGLDPNLKATRDYAPTGQQSPDSSQ